LLTERPARNTFTRRDRVFDLIFTNDPLLSEVDVYLRLRGYPLLADMLLKLARDMGTEEQDDTYINNVKDFGDEAVRDVLQRWDLEKIDSLEKPLSEEILSDYEPVSLDRLNVLNQVAAVIHSHNPDIAPAYDAMMEKFRSIMSFSPRAPQKEHPAPGFHK
jgi:hypothetical protein